MRNRALLIGIGLTVLFTLVIRDGEQHVVNNAEALQAARYSNVKAEATDSDAVIYASDDTLPFEDYLDLDNFCAEQGFEGNSSFAIGHWQYLPTATSVLCLAQDGIHMVAATHNGAQIKHHLIVASNTSMPPAWADRPTMQVEVNSEILESCPRTGEYPIAIVSEWGAVSGLNTEVTAGKRVCVEGEDIVVYEFDGSQRHRFEDYTPYTGGPFIN